MSYLDDPDDGMWDYDPDDAEDDDAYDDDGNFLGDDDDD